MRRGIHTSSYDMAIAAVLMVIEAIQFSCCGKLEGTSGEEDGRRGEIRG